MFDHTSKISAELLAQLAGITSVGQELRVREAAALKQLAVAYHRPVNTPTDELVNLWLYGPDGGGNVGQAVTDAVNHALQDVNALNEAQIMALITSEAERVVREEFTAPPRELVITSGSGTVTLPADRRHPIFERVLRYVGMRENVWLVGPAGSGKTHLGSQVAEALNLPFYFIGAFDQEHKLLGFEDAHGKVRLTDFFKAYTEGGVFLLDEVDGCAPEALLTINAALAGDMASFPNGVFKRHPNFVCIAAANTHGTGADRQYVGRMQQDGSTLDRFSFFEMGYDEALERDLAGNDEWVAHVQKIRAAIVRLKVRHIVSMRASIKGAKALAAGDTWEEAEQAVIWKGQLDSAEIVKIMAEAA